MVLQKQIKLSDYYVKKNGNTISQDGNNVTAANKNVATDGSGNVIFEEKNNHNHDATYVKKTDIDSSLSGSSSNPVQNQVVKSALNGKMSNTGDAYVNTDNIGFSIVDAISGMRIIETYGNTDSIGGFDGALEYDINEGSMMYQGHELATLNDISDATDSDSSTTAASSAAVKSAYDLASEALSKGFKVEVIQDYTVQDLDTYYNYTDGEAFGEYISNEGIRYNANTIYLLKNITDNPSYYNEYVLIDDTQTTPVFELLGTTRIDLSNYISKQSGNSNILLANGSTIAQSSFISKGSTENIQLANGNTTPQSTFATSGHNHDSTYIPLSARKATVTSGDTTGVPTGDAVQKAIDATLDNIITQLRS